MLHVILYFCYSILWKKGAVSFAAELSACFTIVSLYFFVHEAISLALTIVSPFPSADSALVCIASTEATHIVLSDAFSNARFFCLYTFCIDDVSYDFFSTKETGHWALFIQIAARFAVCLIAMFLLSTSFHATVSRLIFCFVAFRAGEPPGRPRNSASAAYRIVNVFIFNVGRCAQSAVRGKEHSLTHKPL